MLETIILAVIMGLVFIGLPVFLGRKTGRSPMEMIFGERVNGTLFGRKKEDSSSALTAEEKDKKKPPVNSSMQELISMISTLVSYARRHRFYSLVPGTLEWEGKTSTLAVILVTRSTVIGINCFGYNGTIQCERGEGEWIQTVGEEKRHLESPARKNKEQYSIVKSILEQCGYPEIPLVILGVFTSSNVQLKNRTGDGFYTKKELMDALSAKRFTQDRGVISAQVGKSLEGYAKKN